MITLVGVVLFGVTAAVEKLVAPWAQPVELTFST
jgi:hypothetical protein